MSNSSTSDFLEKLSSLKSDFKVYVPSLKKEVTADPITLKQQKDIISTSVNGVLGALKFTEALNNVIINNVEGDKFFAFDRLSIILGLRVGSLGDKVKSSKGDIVSLTPSLKTARKAPKFKLTKKVSIDGIQVDLRIPTLDEENKIIKKCILEIDKFEAEELSKAMGVIYIFELIKHIDQVTVGEDTIIFDDIKIQDRVKIVEKLPLDLYDKITSFLEDTTEFDRAVLSLDDEESISLDVSLFDATLAT